MNPCCFRNDIFFTCFSPSLTFSFRLDEFCDEAKARIERAADNMVNRMVVELETGGNVRFEEGSATDVW